MEELDKKISEIVRSTVNEFMESLMKGEIQAFMEKNEGQRNGYCERNLGTRYGRSMISEYQEIVATNSRQRYSTAISVTSE